MIRSLLEKLLPVEVRDREDWSKDADWARHDQEPLRARTLLYVGVAIVLLLLVWSAFAELEEVTRGEGRVIPSRQLQIVQAFDGGVVSEILVREGQTVEVGELLVRIDPTRFVSSLRENRVQYLALLAKTERLKALSEARPFQPPNELVQEAPDILAREQTLYLSSQQEMNASMAIARQQLQQRKEEHHEGRSNLKQLEHRLGLVQKELDVTKPLFNSGAVSEVELLRLERDVSVTRGERDQVLADRADQVFND